VLALGHRPEEFPFRRVYLVSSDSTLRPTLRRGQRVQPLRGCAVECARVQVGIADFTWYTVLAGPFAETWSAIFLGNGFRPKRFGIFQ